MAGLITSDALRFPAWSHIDHPSVGTDPSATPVARWDDEGQVHGKRRTRRTSSRSAWRRVLPGQAVVTRLLLGLALLAMIGSTMAYRLY